MAGEFINNLSRRLRIGPSGVISYPSAGWTVFMIFNPKSGQNDEAYMYSHGDTFEPQDGINIWRDAFGEMKCRVEDNLTTPLDSLTSNKVTANVWNAFALVWDGSNFHMYLNGVQTSVAPAAAMRDWTPPDEVTLGMRADFDSFTPFNGSLCHVTKIDRALSPASGIVFTRTLVSPQFIQEGTDFHVEMFNSSFAFDMQGNRTTTPTDMVYVEHAPVAYPSTSSVSFEDLDPLVDVQRSRLIYVGA